MWLKYYYINKLQVIIKFVVESLLLFQTEKLTVLHLYIII
jgi:hypothetical protein